jgi:L-seryl-tRNA(Ser) seleniumtransferase
VKLEPHLPHLPSVNELLEHPRVKGIVARVNRTTLAKRAAGFLEELRGSLAQRAGRVEAPPIAQLAERLARRLLGEPAAGAAIINATGVVVGDPELTPPLAEAALHALLQVGGDYHQRTSPAHEALVRELAELAGAEAALAVCSFAGAAAMAQSAAAPGAAVVELAPLAGLIDPAERGYAAIATIGARVAAGVDLVVADGAGLLGGPACGLVVGRRQHVDLAASHPLAQAMALDAATVAALHATLAAYRDAGADADSVMFHVPVWQLLSAPLANLQQRAERLAPLAAECDGMASAAARQVESIWAAGEGGGMTAPSWAIAVRAARGDAASLAARLYSGSHPVAARLHEDDLLLDLRSVFPRWDQQLVAALAAAGR